ncbi:MAG: tetratricopeptide repeat protein [Elusimicrobiota bacterium]
MSMEGLLWIEFAARQFVEVFLHPLLLGHLYGILAFTFLSRKAVRHGFQGLSWKAWTAWGLCALLPSVILAWLWPAPFLGAGDAWEELWMARLLADGEVARFLAEHRHGALFPYLGSWLIPVFGESPAVSSALTHAAGFGNVLVIFLLTYSCFRDEAASVWAATLYVFSQSYFRFVLALKGAPTVSLFVIASAVLLWTIAYRSREIRLHLAALWAAALLVNVRVEFGVYLPLFAAGWFLLSGPKELGPLLARRPKTGAVGLGLLLVLLAPACTNLLPGLRLFQGPSVIENLEAYGWGSAGYAFYFARRVPDWLRYWFGGPRLLLLGALAVCFLRLRPEHRRTALWLLGGFLLHNAVYIAFVNGLERRYLVTTCALLLPLLGYGMARVWDLRSRLAKAFLVAAFVFSVSKDLRPFFHPSDDPSEHSWRRHQNVARAEAAIKVHARHAGRNDPIPILVGKEEFRYSWLFLTDRTVLSLQDALISELDARREESAGTDRRKTALPSLAGESVYYVRTPDNGDAARLDVHPFDRMISEACRAERVALVDDWEVLLLSGCGDPRTKRKSPPRRPFSSEIRHRLGLAHLRQRRFAKAIEAFREALRLDPRHPMARRDLGLAYRLAGRPDEAPAANEE